MSVTEHVPAKIILQHPLSVTSLLSVNDHYSASLQNLFNRVKPNRHALKMVHASHLLTIIQVSGSGPPMKLRVSLASLNHLSKTVVGRRKKELERWAEEQFRDVLDKFCVVMGNPCMHA